MRANGTHIPTLTHGFDMEPAVSPNGRKIVFDRGTKHGTSSSSCGAMALISTW